MKLFWLKSNDLEAQGEGDVSELSLVRDKNGNWINEDTREIYAEIREAEEDDDADA